MEGLFNIILRLKFILFTNSVVSCCVEWRLSQVPGSRRSHVSFCLKLGKLHGGGIMKALVSHPCRMMQVDLDCNYETEESIMYM